MGLMKCVPGVLTSDVQDFSYISMLEVVGSVRLSCRIHIEEGLVVVAVSNVYVVRFPSSTSVLVS